MAGLLADPVLTAGLPGLLGEVLPGFLSTPAVSAGLAGVAGDLVAALAVRAMSAAGNPFTLVESTFIQPRTSAQPGFLSLRVAIDGTRMNLVDRQDVQVILATSFGFDPLGGCKERDTAATGLILGFGAASA